MKLSELIVELAQAIRDSGDLPLSTDSGLVLHVRLTPCKDGVSYPLTAGEQNEMHLEVRTLVE